MMKVALIGNMNNNNFAIMRYFRDLGVDAHLLLNEDDGKAPNDHFIPENDTWQIDKWRPYIHQTKIQGSYAAIVGYPQKLKLPPSRRQFERDFNGYDKYIGSGIAPAVFRRFGRRLDIFTPCATGIEYTGDLVTRKSLRKSFIAKRFVWKYVATQQIKGLRENTSICLNAELSLTKQTFDEIEVPFLRLAMPMYYNQEPSVSQQIPSYLEAVLDRIASSRLSIVSHASHTWVRDESFSVTEWDMNSKHNDWLFRSFAKLIEQRPDLDPLLVSLEYGKDVGAAKKLCANLGITKNVAWLPRMSRKEIMILLEACDAGVGEFLLDDEAIWGGTGWEVLAAGKPLLQSFRFKEGRFESLFGYPEPPMLPVEGPDCILNHLIDMADYPDKKELLGTAAKEWFDTYNGIGLAKKWIDLLQTTT